MSLTILLKTFTHEKESIVPMCAALQKRGARVFYISRLRAELGYVGVTSLSPLHQWLVTLDMWHGQRHVHSSAHEAQELFGVKACMT